MTDYDTAEMRKDVADPSRPHCPVGCGVELEPMSRWAPYRTCPTCGTAYWEPPPKPRYWGEGTSPNAEQDAFWSGRHEQRLALIGEGPGRLLDIGCGFGHFVRWANENGWDAWGFDTDAWSVEDTVAPGRVTTELDSLPRHFDLVTLWDVLEHQLEPVRFLRSWHAFLNSNGRVFVAVPNFATLKLRWPLLRRRSDWFTRFVVPHEHAVHFTELGIRLGLERAGYSDVELHSPPPSVHANRAVTWVFQRWPVLRQGMFASARRAGTAAPT